MDYKKLEKILDTIKSEIQSVRESTVSITDLEKHLREAEFSLLHAIQQIKEKQFPIEK